MAAKSDQVKGRAKEAIGGVIGDKDLEAEGKADRRAGDPKEKVEAMTDAQLPSSPNQRRWRSS